MSTIATLTSGESGADSLIDINDNFSALNTDKIETSVIDTDDTLAADSDTKIPSQQAVKGYVDTVVAGVSGTVFPNSAVFSASAAPTTWTDLDLSSVVGTNESLVMLKVFLNHDAAANYAFRTNGDTGDTYTAIGGHAAYIDFNGSTGTGIVMVKTDSSGVIEWIASAAKTTTVTVVAYLT